MHWHRATSIVDARLEYIADGAAPYFPCPACNCQVGCGDLAEIRNPLGQTESRQGTCPSCRVVLILLNGEPE